MKPAGPTIREKILGIEEATAQNILKLFNKEEAKILSDLDDEEILNLTLLLTFADELKLGVIKKLVKHFLELRISRNRLGRREGVVTAFGGGGGEIGRRPRTLRDLFAGLSLR